MVHERRGEQPRMGLHSESQAPMPPVGRFAPSPSGPLHFGSLVAAVASYAEARHRGGRWLLRIEDLDPPRTVPGAADDILRTLESHALLWDGPVVYQSRRTPAYRAALDRLSQQGDTYGCTCSRKQIAAVARHGSSGYVYPGTCRGKPQPEPEPSAIRVRVSPIPVGFIDQIHGHMQQNLETEVGDFVVLRADGIFAYQLAVVVDDADADVSQVVRGMDLFDSTPRQVYLQRLLGLNTPNYVHVPLAVNRHGSKLSKMTQAPAVDLLRPSTGLLAALRFLGQDPPTALSGEPPEAVLAWAVGHWALERVPGESSLRAPDPSFEEST